jgi:energy-coupling factor transport system substrate-specific component
MTKDYQVHTITKFPYSNNFDLYENKNGEMWVLSSNGIYVVTAEELIANGELNTVFYNRNNGLPVVTTANSYSQLDSEGNLYIAGSSGVAKVNIDIPFENVENIKMSVPYVEADGKMIYAAEDGSIKIDSDVQRLTIFSFVYTYSLINPQVTYQLEGFDQEPVTVSRADLEPVAYTNLDGGKYHFKMVLKDAMGHGNKEISVLLVKEKSILEKTWFRVLLVGGSVLLVALLVIFFVRRKTKALMKKQQENKMFIREMIEAFAKTIDMKDKYTNGHSTRVAEYTVMLAKELGYDEETVEKYYNIALLHDIGKIGVPPEVLNKPGKLTDEEFKIIKSHSSLGYRVLKDISIMPELAVGAGAHHERPDGKGYPKGLKGDEIPRVAQIIAVADTFDAMYSDRPYRKRMNFDKAVSIIREVSGTQLTADVVDAFLRLVDKGEFRHPDDIGGGSTEDIDNIHKRQDIEQKQAEEKAEAEKHKNDVKEAPKAEAKEEIKEEKIEEQK